MTARRKGNGADVKARLAALSELLRQHSRRDDLCRVHVLIDIDCRAEHVHTEYKANPDADGEPSTGLSTSERRVLGVATFEAVTAQKLANLAGLSLNYTRAAINSLCEKGRIERGVKHGTYRKKPEA
jgi:hypothetical protein